MSSVDLSAFVYAAGCVSWTVRSWWPCSLFDPVGVFQWAAFTVYFQSLGKTLVIGSTLTTPSRCLNIVINKSRYEKCEKQINIDWTSNQRENKHKKHNWKGIKINEVAAKWNKTKRNITKTKNKQTIKKNKQTEKKQKQKKQKQNKKTKQNKAKQKNKKQKQNKTKQKTKQNKKKTFEHKIMLTNKNKRKILRIKIPPTKKRKAKWKQIQREWPWIKNPLKQPLKSK